MVAPAYTEDTYVDRELSTNLDSTFAFEGPEKLLEIWFWPSPQSVPEGVTCEGLRAIPLHKWKSILDLVSCKILSMKSSAALDAYLLSESSLFVFPHKIILKTCGTTTTLACIDEIFRAAREALAAAGSVPENMVSKEVHKVFYSRRCFMFPDRQLHVHTDWKNEVRLLNKHFSLGKSYVVGDFTSDDHWYLYVGGSGDFSAAAGRGHDQTFEMLMTHLDPVQAQQWVTQRKPGEVSEADGDEEDENLDLGHELGLAAMAASGLDTVFQPGLYAGTKLESGEFGSNSGSGSGSLGSMPSPQLSDSMDLSDDEAKTISGPGIKFVHDAFSFTPCGFSSNSASDGPGGYYYTLHITPEAGWSYASFETNYPFSSCPRVDIITVMSRVLQIFKPGKFSMTLFSDQRCECNEKSRNHFTQLAGCEQALRKLGYAKQEKAVYDLKGEYDLLYLNFAKAEN